MQEASLEKDGTGNYENSEEKYNRTSHDKSETSRSKQTKKKTRFYSGIKLSNERKNTNVRNVGLSVKNHLDLDLFVVLFTHV